MTTTAMLLGAGFVVFYTLIMVDRIDRATLAASAAALLMLTGLTNPEQALHAIDFKTIALLGGMMVIVAVMRETGLFEFLAIRGAQLAKGDGRGIFLMLGGITALLSGLLDNVTTVLLLTPVALELCEKLRLPARPYLFGMILMSNIGGTATLVGDPPNIMIGSAVGLSFNDFLIHLLPLATMVAITTLGILLLLWGSGLKTAPEAQKALMEEQAGKALKDLPLLWRSLAILGLVLLGFFTQGSTGIEPALVAAAGGAFLMLLESWRHTGTHEQHERIRRVLAELEWPLLVFFGGLFIVVGTLEHYGVIEALAKVLLNLSGGNLATMGFSILWGSAILSAVIDNIPFVATMIPMVQQMGPAFGGADTIAPLWWALAAGACLGGNGTLIGASANLVVAALATKKGLVIRPMDFLIVGFPMMLVSIVISTGYLWLRYF